ncbi:neutral ceramidase precursor [Patellaria atrata CBS 101060]|uniref:Neutral ceramidase n=1 Tax=Patellaria atrata CBS 101060 TaxID=1346257 RepID=A0A9P4SG04_9PEZI|nr:neutral ceramidase precursor [Patellaria atrata CBS 101060]
MARSHLAVALAASTLLLVLLAQLFADRGATGQRLWHWNGARADTGSIQAEDGDQYLIGVGKADITGPVVELNLMGYANGSQIGTGLRQRLYSRAFVIGDVSNPSDRFVYLVLDTQSGDTAVRNGILDGLKALGGGYAMYDQHNVAVTGTHSHSGPAAWLNYLLPQITAKGFDKQSYQAIVDGALLSIRRAHESAEAGTLSVATTAVSDANINRSLYAYLANPESERNRYSESVDKTLTLLKFQRSSDGKNIGILTWFAVHGTSMLGNNTIITADNKGVAAKLFEDEISGTANAASDFVAGFSQANVGDTTPNVMGAYCEDGSGSECRFNDSTCGGKSQDCHGRGPFFGLNDAGTKSCYEIGKRQYAGARAAYDYAGTPVKGGTIRSFHTFKDLSKYSFALPNGTVVKTCSAALGYSFAAGTSDGPGAFDFTQNDSGNGDNPLWSVVGGLLHPPSPEQRECQAPKPILLDVGAAKVPYDWTPNIVDIQALRVGQLVIIVSPGEASTMAGRQWREAVASSAESFLDEDPIVVLGGPANSYTHYITTTAEYGIQRYEGASTLYGPHTLAAYINLTLSNLPYLSPEQPSTAHPAAGPAPPDNRERSLSFITGVVFDSAGIGKKFGQVTKNAPASYAVGAKVSVTFVGANPRNNLRLEKTYAAVEKQAGDGSWEMIRNDADWDLLFEWKRTSTTLGTSEVTITWETGGWDHIETTAGTYRIKYYGDSKSLRGSITAFEGTSGIFKLV